MKHAVPEHVALRKGTVDADVWAETIELNVYRLPDVFEPGDHVLDLGAHTGSFSWRCAVSGARVVCVEPSRENYPLLTHNLRPVWDRVLCVHAAAWRSDRMPSVLSLEPGWIPANTGGGCVMGDTLTRGHDVLGLPLDDLLRTQERWRLVKIDVEGAEFPILYTSRELARVDRIAGEYHHRRAALPFADVDGRPLTIEALKAHLQTQGFDVEVEPKAEGMGYFFATRNNHP